MQLLPVEGLSCVQGFQCFVDDHSGFGQMAADVVAELKVDYPNAPVMLYPVRPTQHASSHATVSVHCLSGFHALSVATSSHSSCCTPSGQLSTPLHTPQ